MTEGIADTNESITDEITELEDSSKVELEPITEPSPEPVTPEPQAVHPLSPGGVRFEKVYARGKQAERDLVLEREKRIAAEAKLEALSTRPASNPVAGNEEYSWAQLNEFIAAGRLTLADAQAYREDILRKNVLSEARTVLKKEMTQTDRLNILNRNLSEYVTAVPALTNPSSPERLRVEDEFNWIVEAQGVELEKLSAADRKALELTALRTVYGSTDVLKKRSTVVTAQETHQGIPGGTAVVRKPNPDQELINKLDNRKREYYRSKIATGMYKDWAEVVTELKFDPSNLKKK